jgi:hypothetical protein
MDLEMLEHCWRTEASVANVPELEEADMNTIVRARTEDLHRRVRRRLTREGMWYLPTLGILAASFLQEPAPSRLLWALCLVALLGVLIAVLWQAERSFARVALDRGLQEVLTELAASVDRAARAYLTAYVLVTAGFVTALAGAVWWRHGVGGWLLMTLAGGVALVFWSYRSGRAYVERMFGRTRAELSEYLHELEADGRG